MSMVTTAVAMLSGTKQATVVSKSGQGENEGTKSFAESIGEQMQQDGNVETTESNRGLAVPQMPSGGTPVLDGNQPAPDEPHPPVNGSGALGQMPGNAEAVKAGMNMYQPTAISQNGLDGSGNNANLTAATEADTAIAMPGKAGGERVTDGIDKAENDASSDTIGHIFDGGPTAAEDPLQTASVADATLLPAVVEASQQTVGPHDEKDATAGKAGGEVLAGTQEASTKKVARKHGSTEKKAAPKDASAVGIAAACVAQCAGSPGIQSATPVQASVAASVPMTRVPSGESQAIQGTSAQGSSARTVSTGQQNSEVRAATGADKGSKADAAKVPADALKIAEPSAVDVGVTPKDGLGLEKTSVPAQGGAGSTDAKSQGITVPPVPAHVLAGPSVASGLSGGVVLAQAIAGTASTKPQSGEAGVQLAATHAGAGERSISGAAAVPSPTSGSHRTLFATPTVLEVGVPNGTQGWLKIRAEMAGGGAINASLSAASPAGQEMLHRELPSLTAYLQQERIAVNAVAVHEAAARTPWSGPPDGLSGGMSGQLQQRSGQGGDSQRAATGTFTRATGFDGRDLVESNELSVPARYAGSGNWLSVRA